MPGTPIKKIKTEDPTPKDKGLKTLNYYQKKAIDFSRRNRLLKFPKSAACIEFEVPLGECEQTFGSISEFRLDLPHKQILAQDEPEEEASDEEKEFPLPQTNVIGKKLLTVLDKLRLQAKNNFDSHGLHTLFLTVGELQWKEQLAGRGSSKATTEADYAAPLLLIPIEITNQRAPHKKSVLAVNDEQYDIQINPVLNLFIQQELELDLPKGLPLTYEDAKWEEIQSLLDKYVKVFKEEKGIDCQSSMRIRLGQYTFHGQQIYEDLTRNEENIFGSEFIASLCGNGQIAQAGDSIDAADEDDNIDDFLSAEDDYTILDADESQLRAIRSAVSGKHLVIHGPPGTGKSQTIANLIASLLARGKKVLFVCEKQVALDVVYNRLQTKGADITDLCLPLFKYTSDKKSFAKSIIESRNRVIQAIESTSKDSLNRKLIERTERMDFLKKYFEALTSEIEPLNKTIYWIHGELARVAPKVEDAILPWQSKDSGEIDYPLYQKLISILSDLSLYKDLLFDSENHWEGLKQQTFSPDYSVRLFAKLKELSKLVATFPSLKENVFGSPDTILEIEELLKFSEFLDLDNLIQQKLIKTEKFNLKTLSNEIERVQGIANLLDEYKAISGKDKYAVPTEWKPTKFKVSMLAEDLDLHWLRENKVMFSGLQANIVTLGELLKENKHSSILLNLNAEKLKRYKDIFYADPIVQKINGWDDRASLYKIQEDLVQIKSIHDRLTLAKNVLSEWAISPNDLPESLLWEIEQRFFTKYSSFLRNFYSSYKKDKEIVTQWCVTHRPHNYKEYKEIVSSAADALRLENKFDKMMSEFIKAHGATESVKLINVEVLVDAVNKILSYLEKTNLDKVTDELKTLFIEVESIEAFKAIILQFETIFSQTDALNLATGQNNLTDQTSINDYLKQVAKITSETEKAISVIEVCDEYISETQRPQALLQLHADIATLNELQEICNKLLSLDYLSHTNFENIEELLANDLSVKAQMGQLARVLKIIGEHSLSKEDFYKHLTSFYSNVDTWNVWHKEYSRIKDELSYLMNNTEALKTFESVEMSAFSDYVSEMITDTEGLEKWMKYQRIRSQMEEYGMLWFIDSLQEYDIKADFGDVFVWSFLNRVLADIYSEDEVLRNFNVSDYSRCVAEFRKLEKGVFEVNQYRVLSKVYQNIKIAMGFGGQSERVLLNESQKIKRHLPIRKLVQDNAAHLLSYKPCWMMSPLTLSSYIPYGAVDFDVVIFDEASQMRIENALGSIARAKQVIVIGDEHQLPPTSFFDTSSDEEDEEEIENIGYESILQAAITVLPGADKYLTYHYRSKHSDLIAFSNSHIYKNLTIFPSPRDYEAVRFDFVENGIYDAGNSRRNRIEAQRVAELCIQHAESSMASLGVIAFSKAQEEAIREAITEKIKEYPQLSERFDETADARNTNNEDSSFFIRNLESVQGDERDHIILSVGYGPDVNGNVFNRFGPLNSKGGERRLNVAVTRAKENITLVASMKFHQMSPSEQARGAVLLQKYLEFAEKGRSVLEASKIAYAHNDDADSDFEISVQNALENIGYKIERQVGAAGFSIDLAVVSPENHKEYILGIECDGAAYHSSKSARIRDRLRQEILERLGWKIYRIWSQHWINHRQEVLDDIVKVISQAQ
jgi:superfamily I DNA and/or RNA helicase/very-short-patch-repair endonuclease